jgi:hypothetical protein
MELHWKDEWTAPTISGVVCFGTGIVVGCGISYFLTARRQKRIEEKMTENSDDIGQLEFKFDRHIQDDTRSHDLIEYAHNMIIHAENQTEEQIKENIEEVTEMLVDRIESSKDSHPSNIFSHDVLPWDWDEEVKKRGDDEPYIIHKDEYDNENDEKDFSQSTLTYYKGDDILVDEADVPIHNYRKLTGELKFGHGSCDPSIVYIRNTKMHAEYEILLDHGLYQVEVLGEEIENSFNNEKPIVPKFRPLD